MNARPLPDLSHRRGEVHYCLSGNVCLFMIILDIHVNDVHRLIEVAAAR